ncbi:hypothetical protein BTTAP_160002 [Brochothrix thermosphacta]|uniref:hypothetical protein n=1 Tax=Brochothrix thermosphacta TaxID=2756 RepID=UPI000D798339|nr:hypothetical protein [Brochothrix thermosphacta]SPP27698.1 hypothetical protein BTTAP_160002 [Brochothrix thermosphacta]
MELKIESNEQKRYSVELYRYSSYIHFGRLIEELTAVQKKHESECFSQLLNLNSFNDICKYLETNDIETKFYDLFKKIIIENIIFSSTSHVFISNIEPNSSKESIEEKISLITKEFTGIHQSNSIQNFYNKIDELLIDESKKIHFPAIYEDGDNIIVFSVTRILKQEKPIIVPCMLKFDLTHDKMYSFMCNKFNNLNKKDENDITTINFFHKEIISKLGMLGIQEVLIDNLKKSEYEKKLFLECNRLNVSLIEDYQKEFLQEKTGISKSIKSVIKTLSSIESISLGESEKEKIENQIQSICVGEYITQNVNALQLRKKAITKGLYAYPTKIRFLGDDASRGDTKSTNLRHPLPVHEIFHSLNTSFKYFESIEELRLAWFDSDFSKSNSDLKQSTTVSQTTIKISSGRVIINFFSRSKKNKEMILYVLRKLQEIIEPS